MVERDLAKVEVAGPSPVCRSFLMTIFVKENIQLPMNLYIRYFDNETLVHNVNEALDFLNSIPDIQMTPALEQDIRDYANSNVYFPKRYKVRPRVYFIIIKTEANNMHDFKEKKAMRNNQQGGGRQENPTVMHLAAERPGWYEGALDFKRVVLIPATGKHGYRDTHFVARCKATSGQDCYNRIIDYLRDRVDSRSQFPSAKGKNFKFSYLGMWK